MKLSKFIIFTIVTFFSFTKIAFAVCMFGDCKSGYGESVSKSGTHYKGEFVNGVRLGNGSLTWPDGSNYEGFFKDNKFNGLGTFVWSDGTKYIGYWKNGLQHGEGEKTLPSGSSIYGKFKYGKLKEVIFIMEPGGQKEVATSGINSKQKPSAKKTDKQTLEHIANARSQKNIGKPSVNFNINSDEDKTKQDLTVAIAADKPNSKTLNPPTIKVKQNPDIGSATDSVNKGSAESVFDKVTKKVINETKKEPSATKQGPVSASNSAEYPIIQKENEKPAVDISKKPAVQQVEARPFVDVAKDPKAKDLMKSLTDQKQNTMIIIVAVLLAVALLLFLIIVFSNRKKDRKEVDDLLETEKEMRESSFDLDADLSDGDTKKT
ncbi:MAG: hypothetical protein HQL71_08035, partial [Magnetococcales bacterium]|nr:hypothetical protein [Magnetococcales bacterium]